MGFLKCRQPRQQPFGGERGQRRDGQHMVVVFAEQAVGRKPEIVERSADAGEIFLRLLRQRQRAVLADEQTNAELFLQPLDLMADRGLRDVQLGRRLGEAQMPGGGLKRPQSIQRRQPGGHSANPRYMSLYHPKRYKVSFVERPDSADIGCNRLATGAENVHLHAKSMINHHGPGILSQLAETLHVWRQRYQSRRELASWSSANSTTSVSPGAISPTRPKTVLAGLMAARPASPQGDAGCFLNRRERDDEASFRRSQAIFRCAALT